MVRVRGREVFSDLAPPSGSIGTERSLVIVRISHRRLIVGLCLLSAIVLPGSARAQKDPEFTVSKSLQVLSEITRNPKTGMPRLVMRKAAGFAIIPDMFKLSFVFGARFGRGVVVVRQPDGSWSNPVFIQLAGGSFGVQAGAQSTDLILVFQTQKGLDRFINGKGKITLGVDVGAAAGPVGKRFEASTDAALKAEILSYSNSRGLFAGVSAEGGTLQIDWRANTLYYHQPVSPMAILAANSALAVPPSAISLQQILAEKTAWPERVARGPKTRTGPVIVDEEIPAYEDDGVEIKGGVRDEPLPGSASERPRAPSRREVRPQAEPGGVDDLDFIPTPAPRNKKPAPPASRRRNDEDLTRAGPSQGQAGKEAGDSTSRRRPA